jgi:hypothetical protein
MLQLEDVLRRLWRAKIDVRIVTAPPASISATVRVGNGVKRSQDFTGQGKSDEIARWLDATARDHFPDRYKGSF